MLLPLLAFASGYNGLVEERRCPFQKVGKFAKNGLFPHSDFRLKVTKNVLCSKYDILMGKNRRRTSDTAFES